MRVATNGQAASYHGHSLKRAAILNRHPKARPRTETRRGAGGAGAGGGGDGRQAAEASRLCGIDDIYRGEVRARAPAGGRASAARRGLARNDRHARLPEAALSDGHLTIFFNTFDQKVDFGAGEALGWHAASGLRIANGVCVRAPASVCASADSGFDFSTPPSYAHAHAFFWPQAAVRRIGTWRTGPGRRLGLAE